MSAVKNLESSILAPNIREALQTLLSQINELYLDLPSTSDGLRVCISTSYADFRRYIETKH